MTDIAHKIFSPKTYECQLCKISHGWFSMHDEWRLGIEKLNVEPEYYHRDKLPDAIKTISENFSFPCILLQSKESIQMLIDHKEINKLSSIEALLLALSDKIK